MPIITAVKRARHRLGYHANMNHDFTINRANMTLSEMEQQHGFTYPSLYRQLERDGMLRWSSNFGHNDRFKFCHFLFVDRGWQIAQC